MASKYIPSCSGSRLLVAAQKTVGLPGLISRGTARNLPSWQETAWPLPKSLITRPSEVVLPTASSAGAAATTRQASQEGKSGTGTEERGAAAPVGSTDGACPAHGGACRSSANGGSTRSIDAGPNLLEEMLMMSTSVVLQHETRPPDLTNASQGYAPRWANDAAEHHLLFV